MRRPSFGYTSSGITQMNSLERDLHMTLLDRSLPVIAAYKRRCKRLMPLFHKLIGTGG